MQTLTIEALQTEGIIGVHPWERQLKQKLYWTLILTVDVSRAALTDDLADTLDYSDLATRFREFIACQQRQLLECLAAQAADFVCAEFPVHHLILRVSKPLAIADAKCVTYELERDNSR